MNKDYVSYELAKKLKSAGFDEPCDYCYITHYGTSWCIFERGLLPGEWNSEEADSPNDPYQYTSAPTLAHAQKWLREVKRLSVQPYANIAVMWNYNISDLDNFATYVGGGISYPSYEQALSAGIEAALELIKKGE